MSISIRSLLEQSPTEIRLLECHDHASAEAVRETAGDDGQRFQGTWISGLTQTTYLGIPDTELVSPLKRATLLASHGHLHQEKEEKAATRRPLCAAFDADSGGAIEDIPALVAVLALHGISMVIVEDKAVAAPGAKVNSLLATSGTQGQATMRDFAAVVGAFRAAAAGRDVMVTARIESFTTRTARADPAEDAQSLRAALDDALVRAHAYTAAGADAVMIHSKAQDPGEVLAFLRQFRARDAATPLVVVPTAYARTSRAVLSAAGATVFIYANHLMRAKIKAAGDASDRLLTARPGLLAAHDRELRACLEARNFACLLQKLAASAYRGDDDYPSPGGDNDNKDRQYRLVLARRAAENMRAVVRDLAVGHLCGCEADERIVPVKLLLKINARQVSVA